MSESNTPGKPPRPLSPHLQVYSWQLTMMTSILHRATGVALTFGLILISVAIYLAATGSAHFDALTGFFATPFGLVITAGFVASCAYHFCAGIRHLIFDTGALLDLKSAYAAGYTVLACSAILTALIMVCILHKLGVINV